MKHISNEQKAKKIAENIVGNDHYSYFDKFKKCALQAMQWKDEQFKYVIIEIKANIIESRDNKEYYKTNRETTLNWVLRLIDECYESISTQKEDKL